jgi:DNA-binding PadR family transcriptional regulator
MQDKILRKLFLGFIQIHILHHAKKEAIYGAWMLEELESHGYEISPGTLYPILHDLEKSGYLSKKDLNIYGKIRKYYEITPQGIDLLEEARAKAYELFKEIKE